MQDTGSKYYEQGVTEDTTPKLVIQNVDEDFSNSSDEIKDNNKNFETA
jgi:hypothetical protein